MRRSRKSVLSITLLLAMWLMAGAAQALERNVSGMWWDPARDGEGLVVDLIDESSAVVYWFTYDTRGNQLWLVGTGNIVANRIEVGQMLRPSGGVFGVDFDPDEVALDPWGEVTLTFPACKQATIEYDGPSGFGSGSIDLERLTGVAGASCQSPSADPGIAGGITGNWFDPTHDGEGFLVHAIGDGRALIVWFTYDKNGKPAWFVATGEIVNGRYIAVSPRDTVYTRGARFGDDFDTADVERTPFGTLTFEFTSCSSGIVRYSGLSPFGGGQQLIQRLYTPRDVACQDGGARPPRPVSVKMAEQNARAVSGTATREDGLVLSASASDGTAIELSIPSGAVPQDVTVTLTPSALDVDTSNPFAGADSVVAMIEPHGLQLMDSATLSFSNLPEALNDAATFGFLDRGDDAHGLPFRSSGATLEFPVNHFSGAAVIDLGVMELDLEPATPGDRAVNDLSTLIDEDNFESGPAGDVYQNWFDTDVRPALQAAESDPRLIDRALDKFNEWRNSLEDINLVGDFGLESRFADEMTFALDSLARAIRNGVDSGKEECIEQGNPEIAGELMRWNLIADALDLFGRQGLSRTFVEDAVRDCARFKLIVDVEIDSSTMSGTISSTARAEVPLVLDEDLIDHAGEGEFEYINLSVNISANGFSCTNNDVPVEDGTFIVLPSPVFEIFLGYAERGSPSIRHVFSRMEEDWVTACPLPVPPGEHPFEEFIHLTSGFVSGLALSPEVSSSANSVEPPPPPVHEGDGFIATLDEEFTSDAFREFILLEEIQEEGAQIVIFAHYQLFHDPRR